MSDDVITKPRLKHTDIESLLNAFRTESKSKERNINYLAESEEELDRSQRKSDINTILATVIIVAAAGALTAIPGVNVLVITIGLIVAGILPTLFNMRSATKIHQKKDDVHARRSSLLDQQVIGVERMSEIIIKQHADVANYDSSVLKLKDHLVKKEELLNKKEKMLQEKEKKLEAEEIRLLDKQIKFRLEKSSHEDSASLTSKEQETKESTQTKTTSSGATKKDQEPQKTDLVKKEADNSKDKKPEAPKKPESQIVTKAVSSGTKDKSTQTIAKVAEAKVVTEDNKSSNFQASNKPVKGAHSGKIIQEREAKPVLVEQVHK